MAFRTVEITKPTEIHIKSNQLEVTQEDCKTRLIQ